MSLWTMPAVVSAALDRLAAVLDRRTRDRFWSVFFGILLCREKRRTASAWFRAAGIGTDFRRAYDVLGSVGRRVGSLGTVLLGAIERVAGRSSGRAVFALDDTVTKRFGPCVEGAGVHHNPTPGPAAQAWVYGHVWVTLARVVRHPCWGAIGLPVRAALYVRAKDIGTIPPEYRWPFRTKLELAAELIGWLAVGRGREAGHLVAMTGVRHAGAGGQGGRGRWSLAALERPCGACPTRIGPRAASQAGTGPQDQPVRWAPPGRLTPRFDICRPVRGGHVQDVPATWPPGRRGRRRRRRFPAARPGGSGAVCRTARNRSPTGRRCRRG